MIVRRRALRELASGSGRAESGGGMDFWDECRTVGGGIDMVRRAIRGWRRPARGRPGKPRKGTAGPGKAANVGEYAIIEGDLNGRLMRLGRGNPERMGRALTGVVANLFRAKGESPEIAGSRDAPEDRPDGWPDGAHMMLGKGRSRTAVACISGQPDEPEISQKVAGLREACKTAGVRKAIVVTDRAFVGECRDETDGDIKVEIWGWNRLDEELRTHLLELQDGNPGRGS